MHLVNYAKSHPEMIPALEEKIKIEQAGRHIFPFLKFTFKRYKRENWHHELICRYYENAIMKINPFTMIFAPPRHMKTEALERSLAFAIGQNPDIKVMSCAYGGRKSNNISKNVKAICKSKRFKMIFPAFNKPGVFGIRVLDTTTNWEIGGPFIGSYLAQGVGGSITGEGFNIGTIDDPVKSREEAESPTYQEKTFDWYNGTFLTRQDEADAVIILINTRWNRKDLAGKILQAEGIKEYNGHVPSKGCPNWNGQPNGVWTVLSLPAEMDEEAYKWKHPEDPREIGEALWPARFPMSYLKKFKKSKRDWASLWQQRPKPEGGNIIDRKWFYVVDRQPNTGHEEYLRFWDMAGTPKEKRKKNDPDFTAGVLVCKSGVDYYIIDVKFIRETPKKVEDLVLRTAKMDWQTYPNIKIEWEEEGGAAGKLLTSHYNEKLAQYKRGPYRSDRNKNFYIDLLANKAETGNVYVVNGPWLYEEADENTFFDELEEYPKGTHDDRIDAAAKAMYRLSYKIDYEPDQEPTSMLTEQDEIGMY